MRNGSMFGGLKRYRDPAYREAHPSIYILNDAGVLRYDIFAAYEAATDAETFTIGFSDGAAKQEFLKFALSQSVWDAGVEPSATDPILTLTTCTGRGYSTRWVVQAVLCE